MNHTISVFAICLGAAGLAALGGIATAKPTAGKAIQQTRTVTKFHSVEISGAFAVRIDRGDTQSVTLSGSAKDLEFVETEVDDGELEISLKRGSYRNGDKITVHIVTPTVKKLAASGAVKIVASDIRSPRLDVDCSGASELTLAGEVDVVRYDLSGASEVDALELITQEVSIDASGATEVKVHAKKSLEIDASGASKISYAGEPKTIRSETSGVGSVRKI